MLVSGGGALDFTQPRFAEAGDAVAVTAEPWRPLPDEPQALDFAEAP